MHSQLKTGNVVSLMTFLFLSRKGGKIVRKRIKVLPIVVHAEFLGGLGYRWYMNRTTLIKAGILFTQWVSSGEKVLTCATMCFRIDMVKFFTELFMECRGFLENCQEIKDFVGVNLQTCLVIPRFVRDILCEGLLTSRY